MVDRRPGLVRGRLPDVQRNCPARVRVLRGRCSGC